MMSISQIVLAADDVEGIFDLAWVVVMVIIAIAGAFAQKANKAKAARKEQEEAAGRRRQGTGPQPRLARRPQAGRTAGAEGLQVLIESRHTGSAHVGQLEHTETAEKSRTHAIRVDLSAVSAAKRAILLHEIFSPPKALRKEPEMWEM